MDAGHKEHRNTSGLHHNQAGSSGEKSRGKKVRLLLALSIILAAVAGGIWVYSSGIFRQTPDMLLVTSGDKMVIWRQLKNIPDGTIPVEGPLGTTIVEVERGRVRVLSSPCPEHICMNTGWISKPGQIIVCMPNQVVVRIVKKQA
ncbi:MAG TPA: NusG domain II-containing protein [Firmicutes bacterium]|nr:NusG domain II-containing protein [Bacillota bacterium]